MEKWMMGLALLAAGWGVNTVQGQYPPANAHPAHEPVPFAPSTIQASHMAGPPMRGAGAVPVPNCPTSPTELPGNLPGAFPTEGDGCPCPADTVRLWFNGEYLHWWVKNGGVEAPLVTTSVSPDLTTNFGAIGQTGTVVLLGANADTIDFNNISGGRISGGWAPRHCVPIEYSVSWLREDLTLFSAQSGGASGPLLARPVVASQLDPENQVVFLAGFPGQLAGGIVVAASTDLLGADTNIVCNIQCMPCFGFDVLLGYRYQSLNESLTITNAASSLDPESVINFNGDPDGFGPGNTTIVRDNFKTNNTFHGGQIGARAEFKTGAVNLLLDGKLGIGQTSQVVGVSGSSTLVHRNPLIQGPITVPGGILAVQSNAGRFTSSEFSFLPEVGANLGIQLNKVMRFTVGYHFLYWSNVVRPGDQVTSIVDTRQAPTDIDFSPSAQGALPPRVFRQTDFWAHGFNVGLAFGW